MDEYTRGVWVATSTYALVGLSLWLGYEIGVEKGKKKAIQKFANDMSASIIEKELKKVDDIIDRLKADIKPESTES